MITELKENEVFVFGSNTLGRHGKGAALFAREKFGAIYGIGEGFANKNKTVYAFPTRDGRSPKIETLPLESLKNSRDKLYKCCEENKDKRFLLTKVGTGLAGYTEETMMSLFSNPPENLILPEDWAV